MNEYLFNPEYVCSHLACKQKLAVGRFDINLCCKHQWRANKCILCGAVCERDTSGSIILYDTRVL